MKTENLKINQVVATQLTGIMPMIGGSCKKKYTVSFDIAEKFDRMSSSSFRRKDLRDCDCFLK